MNRCVRTLHADEVEMMVAYFRSATPDYLCDMGVDRQRLPERDQWIKIVSDDFERPTEERQFYYVGWELDGQLIGHSNINKILFGQEAYMHLHIWDPMCRGCGHGTYYVKQSIATYFQTFDLDRLFCEPYALNPAPNRTLPKVGFEWLQEYETTPGWINFRQPVNRWQLTRKRWLLTRDRTDGDPARGDANLT